MHPNSGPNQRCPASLVRYGICIVVACVLALLLVNLRNVVALFRVMFCVTAGSDAVNQTRCSLVLFGWVVAVLVRDETARSLHR